MKGIFKCFFLKKDNVKITCNSESLIQPEIKKALQLALLFHNIISNAVKYNKRDPYINIRGKKEISEKNFRIEIEDNGIGIEKHNIPLIFKPFKRLHTEEQYSGSGLGLSIASKIVEQYSGEIRVESTPGKGSLFIINLPIS